MLDFAAREDRRALEELWLACFGGPQEYLDFYFGRRFVPADTLVWREGGKPVSMMTLMNVSIAGRAGAYVYAVATLPACRGRGLMRRLDGFAKEVCRSRGLAFTALVPANRPLFAMYEKLGYHAGFFLWEGEASIGPAAAGPVEGGVFPCSFAEFARMRADYLSRFPGAVIHPQRELRYIYEELTNFSGKVFRLTGREDCYAACTVLEDRTLWVRECSAEDPCAAARAILAALGLKRAKIHSPDPFAGARRIPYGMGRLLDGDRPLSAEFSGPFYMALMLD